jgi:hypothetical protein
VRRAPRCALGEDVSRCYRALRLRFREKCGNTSFITIFRLNAHWTNAPRVLAEAVAVLSSVSRRAGRRCPERRTRRSRRRRWVTDPRRRKPMSGRRSWYVSSHGYLHALAGETPRRARSPFRLLVRDAVGRPMPLLNTCLTSRSPRTPRCFRRRRRDRLATPPRGARGARW